MFRDGGYGILAQVKETVGAQIIEVLSKVIPSGIPISDGTRIARDLGLDSVAVMDFVMELEERFDILIPLDQIADVETVRDLTRAVEILVKDAA
ncbi:MAG: acyl carrier protein [Alphaproteobacteria bacterium]|nr:acyl carrier protein [Alphaproteobacteria bacterium]